MEDFPGKTEERSLDSKTQLCSKLILLLELLKGKKRIHDDYSRIVEEIQEFKDYFSFSIHNSNRVDVLLFQTMSV